MILRNKHLLNSIKKLGEDVSNPNLITNFIFELKVSNLLIPAIADGEDLIYETLILDEEEIVLLPLFTSEDEFYKFYDNDSEYVPVENEFEIYAEIIADEDINGIVIDPEGVGTRIPKEMIEIAETDFSIDFDDVPTRSVNEIRQVYENASNGDLIKFIGDKSNESNFEDLMVELSGSDLMNLVVSIDPLDEFAEDGVIKSDDVGGFTLYVVEYGESGYGALFTDKQAISNSVFNDDFHYYVQLTKVSALFDFVLTNDMDGVIINPNTDNFIIPRAAILSQASGIEVVVEDQSFRNCLDYAFLL